MKLSRSVHKPRTYLTKSQHTNQSIISRNNIHHYSLPNELIVNSLRKKRHYATSTMKNELKNNIHSKCEEISQHCQMLFNQIQLSTNEIPNEKNIIDSQKGKDPYLISIKQDIQSYAKDIDKKGTFISIMTNNTKGPKTIFLSLNNNNVFAKTQEIDRLTPNATIKFKNKLVNDYDLFNRKNKNNRRKSFEFKEQEKFHCSVLRLHDRFLTTYNKELDFINFSLSK